MYKVILMQLLMLFVLTKSGIAQIRVVDAESSKPIPYCNVKIKNSTRGVLSDGDGVFSIPNCTGQDTLVVSSIGYEKLTLTFAKAKKYQNLKLKRKKTKLKMVKIASKKWKYKKVGNTSRRPSVNYVFPNNNPGTEFGMLFKIKQPNTYINSINLYFGPSSLDSNFFRVHMYNMIDGLPGNEILEQDIIVKIPSNKCWSVIKPENYNISVDENVFVSLEYLNPSKDICYFAGKLINTQELLTRDRFADEWERPPGKFGIAMYLKTQFEARR